MDLNDYRDEAGDFLRQLGASKQEVAVIVKYLKEDFAQLMKFFDGGHIDTHEMGHKTYDMIFLLMELASMFDTDLNEEWNLGRLRKKKKYLDKTMSR